jgi:hypothetical protein
MEIPSVIIKKATGSSSHDLLSGDIYKSMVIELVYVQGFEPSATAINNFISFLNARSNKRHNGRKRSIASPGKATLQIRKLQLSKMPTEQSTILRTK